MKRVVKKFIPVALKGAGMGAADVIPGVSGGTVAFITGIYEELITSIKAVVPALLFLVRTGNFRTSYERMNGNFLLSVFFGIALSIFTLAGLLKFVLAEYPVLLNGFFFGLIAASVPVIGVEIKKHSLAAGLVLIAGVIVAYYISTAVPATTPDASWFIFLSGAIAVCAMILPGISGSFILLLMGKYETIIGAVSDLNAGVLAIFAGGCVVGLFSFAQLLSLMFKHFKNLTMALLTGFMAGSLAKVWPWKETLSYRINSKGEEVPFIQENILPARYDGEPYLWGVAALMIIGAAIVPGLHFAKKKQEK